MHGLVHKMRSYAMVCFANAAWSFLFSVSVAYAAIGPVAELEIVNKIIAPDGFSRSAVLAGGTFPGPLIRGNKGSNFELNVVDDLTDSTMLKSTSIHWHGIFQSGTPWEDGPAFVTREYILSGHTLGVDDESTTECPITPKHSFLYNFKAPGQAGTFWYHSHLSTQYCDGLRGPLVIYDPNDPQKHLYDIDDETTIITLADWYHYPAPSHPAIPALNSTLINGLGRYLGGPLSKLAVISVSPHKRYRFRLVSISCDPNWIFSIDGHTMTIIEVDGVNHKPLECFNPVAGQRYSFVLNANKPVDNYWIRAEPTLALPGVNHGFANGTNSAILRYVGAPIRDPTTQNTTSKLPLIENNLKPLVKTPVPGVHAPGKADRNLNLVISLGPNGTFQINNASFVPPKIPVLLQILSGAKKAQELMPKDSIIELKPNQVVEVSIPGGSIGAPHPFHLHGHNFFVVRSAGNSSYNYIDPPIRDVVSTGASISDLTTFRFVTDNSGPWFLHCHIDWHLDVGLAVVFAENIPGIQKENPPYAWDQLCPIYDASAQD
ncbi:Laccase I [Mycena indigotica]|uniref:laccase n=1 Tax=Mycena indigotica TaxID=2126181 RepID=A0A8H6T2N0_9AGAR|nr:Laccase I [Mycena indigotica]KAF7309247.1 Laccase I [Mycena indigotica]